MTNLQDLLTRVESGEGPERELDEAIREIERKITGTGGFCPDYTSIVDDALAFKDAVLRGESYSLSHDIGTYFFRVWFGQKIAEATHKDLCRAILAACLKALIAKGEKE